VIEHLLASTFPHPNLSAMHDKRTDITTANTPATVDAQQEFCAVQLLAALASATLNGRMYPGPIFGDKQDLTMDCADLSKSLHHSRCTCQTCLVGRCTANQAGHVGGITSALRCHRGLLGPPCDNVSQVGLDASVFLSPSRCLRCTPQN